MKQLCAFKNNNLPSRKATEVHSPYHIISLADLFHFGQSGGSKVLSLYKHMQPMERVVNCLSQICISSSHCPMVSFDCKATPATVRIKLDFFLCSGTREGLTEEKL